MLYFTIKNVFKKNIVSEVPLTCLYQGMFPQCYFWLLGNTPSTFSMTFQRWVPHLKHFIVKTNISFSTVLFASSINIYSTTSSISDASGTKIWRWVWERLWLLYFIIWSSRIIVLIERCDKNALRNLKEGEIIFFEEGNRPGLWKRQYQKRTLENWNDYDNLSGETGSFR